MTFQFRVVEDSYGMKVLRFRFKHWPKSVVVEAPIEEWAKFINLCLSSEKVNFIHCVKI